MTLKAFFPDSTNDTPRDFEFTGEWYVSPQGRLMFHVKTQLGWRTDFVNESEEVERRFLWWRWKQWESRFRSCLLPDWHYAWVSEDDLIEVNECKS